MISIAKLINRCEFLIKILGFPKYPINFLSQSGKNQSHLVHSDMIYLEPMKFNRLQLYLSFCTHRLQKSLFDASIRFDNFFCKFDGLPKTHQNTIVGAPKKSTACESAGTETWVL